MHSESHNNIVKKINILFRKLLDLYVKANYHEYPIMDKEGNIIGSEFVTTHGGLLIRPKILTKNNNKSAPDPPLIIK